MITQIKKVIRNFLTLGNMEWFKLLTYVGHSFQQPIFMDELGTAFEQMMINQCIVTRMGGNKISLVGCDKDEWSKITLPLEKEDHEQYW